MEKVLPYDRAIVPQETGYWCGPAAAQVVLDSRGIKVAESVLAREIGTHTGGTDFVGLIERMLDKRVPDAAYASTYIENAVPTQAQVDQLWARAVASIDAGWGVIMNWVAPPTNKPRGVNGSVSPSYSGGTTYHYVSAMGYKDDVPGVGRALWIADSGFRPFGFWVSLAQAAQLITPKGYTYATVIGGPPPTPAPVVYTREGNIKTVIAVGQRMGVKPRGIKIGLATTEVESNTRVLANPKVPESLLYPNQGVGTDGFSVGMQQQQVVMGANGWWWGDTRTCMDPVLSSELFFGRLLKLDYLNPNKSPGSFAQAVQNSAYPTRYDERFAAASALYDQFVGQVVDADGEDTTMTREPSRSIYRTSNEPTMTGDDASRGADACAHMHWVESCAERGETWALDLVRATARGTGPGATAWWEAVKDKNTKVIDPWAVQHATDVFDNILATNRPVIERYLATKGQAA